MTDLTGARTFDSNDPAAIAERDKQVLIRQIAADKMLREQMSFPQGRNFYWDQLAACHMFEGTGPMPAESANFFLGERNVGLRILGDLMRAAPDAFVQMLKERGNG